MIEIATIQTFVSGFLAGVVATVLFGLALGKAYSSGQEDKRP